MVFLDTETCGLHGFAVLLQYAVNDGPIHLWSLWKEEVGDTLLLLESIANDDVVGFNLTFDWFHLQKIYSVFSLFRDRFGETAIPEYHIDDIAELEAEARSIDLCLKPKRACDLMLHARKGRYQSLMARKDIRIRRVPAALAHALAAELEARIEIDGIYFSRKKDKHAPRWVVYDIKDTPELKDVVLKFSASGALKVLAEHALGYKQDGILKFDDIEVDKKFRPYEKGWAPFASAFSSREKKWKLKVKKDGKIRTAYTWPCFIQQHIDHWAYHDLARKYANDDIVYTRDLWKHFDRPEPGDDDSELACMVGSVRWRGFSVNAAKLQALKDEAKKRLSSCPVSPQGAIKYIHEVMDAVERMTFKSSKKVLLEELATQKCDCLLEDGPMLLPGMFFDSDVKVQGPCSKCGGSGKHPAATRAAEVLDARKAKKEIEVYDKLLIAGRFHASFIIIGTLSSRMSGTDGLNAQGINRKYDVRDCFTLADPGFSLCGGDFDSFEVVIAEAIYNDPQLRKALTEKKPCERCDATGIETCKKCKPDKPCGKCIDGKITCDECGGTKEATYKLHGLFGAAVAELTYADVIKSKGTDKDWYSIGKAGIFAMMYGGDWNTLVMKQGIAPERAQRAEKNFGVEFPGVARARQRIIHSFCSMTQPAGLGTKVVWKDPEERVLSLLGFPRYFTLENQICKALYDLGQKIPEAWKKMRIKVRRREKEQYVGGATSSALYGAAFSIQALNMRAAANHEIQSTGAGVTKRVQRRIWDHQPHGVNRWVTVPMNCHDEIAAPTRPEYVERVKQTVYETVESFRPKIPLIKMDWAVGASSWATMK